MPKKGIEYPRGEGGKKKVRFCKKEDWIENEKEGTFVWREKGGGRSEKKNSQALKSTFQEILPS